MRFCLVWDLTPSADFGLRFFPKVNEPVQKRDVKYCVGDE